jgi:hypothetical protein
MDESQYFSLKMTAEFTAQLGKTFFLVTQQISVAREQNQVLKMRKNCKKGSRIIIFHYLCPY